MSAMARNKMRVGSWKEQQQRFVWLGESFEREMARCTSRLELVPHETLRRLNSVDTTRPSTRLFGVKEHDGTMVRYKMYATLYLCYCVRAQRLGREQAEAELAIQFTGRQWTNVYELVCVLVALTLAINRGTATPSF